VTTLIRRSLALPILITAVLGLAACSGGGGTPTASSTSSDAPSKAAGNPLAPLAPCDLLSQDQLTSLGLGPGKPDNTAKSRGCEWAKGTSYALGIYLDGSQPIETAGTGGAVKVDLQSHDAVQTVPDGFGCGVEIAISGTASVAVNVSSGPNACQVAQEYAGLIESKLPAQQK
jgi:hypothetical protein